MARPKFVQIPLHRLDRFRPLLGADYARVEEGAARAKRRFAGRAIWHVSSTMRGGGVAEMLHTLLPYARDAGIDARWVVLRERAAFFELTKRLHNNLHGMPGDGGELGDGEQRLYESTLAASARYLLPLIQPGDVVFLHDPQTAGLAPAAMAVGARVIWRCHVGVDNPNEIARRAWSFLGRYVETVDACVFSREAYAWENLDRERIWTIAPSIDPFSPKNQELEPATVGAILGAIGLGPGPPAAPPAFTRADGSPARIERRAEAVQEAPLPKGAAVIVQVSRWDRLKDHGGLLECFARHTHGAGSHLILAGPAAEGVADDPEASLVWSELVAAFTELPDHCRRRVHLLSLPMSDLEENAAMVNALQRRAELVVQKSLAEGFGLTVAEAMWKWRAVIGARVGGIQDQIVDGQSGVLLDDPTDLDRLGGEIDRLLADHQRARALGVQAHRRVAEHYLAPGRLLEYADLLTSLRPAVGEIKLKPHP